MLQSFFNLGFGTSLAISYRGIRSRNFFTRKEKNMNKSLLSSLAIIFFFSFALSNIAHSQVNNVECTVKSSQDEPDGGLSGFHSLRFKIEQYNRNINRSCLEKIFFELFKKFNIVAKDTFTIDQTNDDDYDGDGNNLILGGPLADVVIDGSQLEKDQCVFEIYSDNVKLSYLTIRVWDADYAICDHGSGNEISNVNIIETKPTFKIPYPFRKVPMVSLPPQG